MASFNELINSEKPVLVDFHAVWCGPCKMMEPYIKELAGELDDKIKIVKVDVDKNPAVAGKYQIRGVPTIMLFQNGKVLWRQSGVVSKDQMKQAIMQYA